MSDLFGKHIVGFPTRWLIYSKNSAIGNRCGALRFNVKRNKNVHEKDYTISLFLLKTLIISKGKHRDPRLTKAPQFYCSLDPQNELYTQNINKSRLKYI